MKPKRNFPAVPTDLRNWTSYLSGLFYTGEWETEFGGCTTTPVGTARYTVSAGIVCLSLPLLSGTSDSTLAFLDGLPDAITPEHGHYCLIGVTDNGVPGVGLIHIGTDTGITLYKDVAAGAWTAAGTKGITGCVVTYPLD